MSNQDRLISEILQRLAEAVGKGDIGAIAKMHEAIFRTPARVAGISGTTPPSAMLQANSPESPQGVETEDPRKQLEAFASRDALSKHLSEAYKTKAALVALAKKLGIPVKNADSAKVVTNKIINDTVGARLQASAIRGP